MYAKTAKPITPAELGYVEYDRQTEFNRNQLFTEDTDARIDRTLLGRWLVHMQGWSPIYYQITRVYKMSVEVRRCYGIGQQDHLDSDWGDRTSIEAQYATDVIRSRDALRVDTGVVL